MSYIKEPKGIDLVINGRSLTKKEEEAISAFIKQDKLKKERKPRLNLSGN